MQTASTLLKRICSFLPTFEMNVFLLNFSKLNNGKEYTVLWREAYYTHSGSLKLHQK